MPHATHREREKVRPAAEFKSGMVKALVWPNATANGTRYNVTFQRLYRADDTWKVTQNFNVRDLVDVLRVTVEAERFVREHTETRKEAAA